MRYASFLSILLGLTVATGCGGMSHAPDAPQVADAMAPPPAQAPPGSAPEAPAMAAAPSPVSQPTPMAPTSARGAKEVSTSDGDKELSGDHMLIFTGSINMEVDSGDIAPSIDAVVDAAASVGGYVAEQNDHSVTVRVPSKSFRGSMRALEKIGEVTHRAVQAQDVSEEYNDLDVRLKSLRATRTRLEKFLDHAKTIEDVLRVEQELTRLNGEIDRLEGRMRFLSQRASFSTITVAFTAKPVQPKVLVEKKETPPPPPPVDPKTRPLPIDWLAGVGIDHLLDLR